MSWQPLLAGSFEECARETVQVILDDLAALGQDSAGDPWLAGGTTGLAILHGYLAQIERGTDHGTVADRCLQRATAAAADHPTEASLYSGLTGVGWAICHLQSRLPDLDGEDDAAEIDEVLLHHLEQSPWLDNYDLIRGLVGLGVYALERLPRPTPIACLERVIDRLAETAEQRPEGITWWTNPAWLHYETRERCPRGYYNLGLAHGVPGVIALLGQACVAGVGVAKARPLLEGAVRWLLAQQITGGSSAGFPVWVELGTTPTPARLAWCYGDPGVAAALLWTARGVHEPDWERAALTIAQRAAHRLPEDSGVVDAGLCHGAAGLGHLFNRMFQATGDAQLGEAARFWFRRALEMRRRGRGIGGYEAWVPREYPGVHDPAQHWVAEPGLLTGAAGIALALLAATTAVEPAWDRMMLVAIPPRGTQARVHRDQKLFHALGDSHGR